MDQYMTSVEAESQWNLDAGTIQNLCRDGRLTGAIKRGGNWFIPLVAANPLENGTTSGEKFNFTGTKKKVFDTAIELFSMRGYENVSIRDVSDAVQITQSTIYNHFTSKQELLDTIYEYYTVHFYENQRPAEELKKILETGTRDEFCAALMFTFEQQDQDIEKRNRMIMITKIIYMRLYQDERARDIFLYVMNSNVEDYVQEILKYGVSIGILKEFDIPTYAKFLIGQRHIMGMKAFASPGYEPQQLEEEALIMKMSADMLPFAEK